MKRMERIENLDLVAFREQGIVGADVIIPTSTTSFPLAAALSMVPDGSILRYVSSCRFTVSIRGRPYFRGRVRGDEVEAWTTQQSRQSVVAAAPQRLQVL